MTTFTPGQVLRATDLTTAFAGKLDKLVTPDGALVARAVEKILANVLTPQDFGPAGFSIADSTAAVQSFFMTIALTGGRGYIPPGAYVLSSTVTITIGTQSFDITGAGSSSVQFLAAPTFSASPVLKLVGTGASTQWKLGGFTVQPSGSGAGAATTGWQIGDPSATTNINGYHYSEISHVQILNFPTLWDVVHARMISFVRCSGWTRPGYTYQTALNIRQTGHFTGDLIFDTCQFVTDRQTGNSAVRITSSVGPYDNTNGEKSLSGIKWITCLIYSGDRAIDIRAANAGYISDLWFIATQIDQLVNYGFSVIATGSGTVIQNIHWEGGYINSALNSQVEINAIGLGCVTDVFVQKSAFLSPKAFVLNAYGVGGTAQNIHFDNNTITDPDTPNQLIAWNCVKGFSCTNNSARRLFTSNSGGRMIQIEATGDDFVVSGNTAKGCLTGPVILDNSGDCQKIVANNPGYNPMPLATIIVGASPFVYKNTSGSPQIVSVYGGGGVGLTMDTIPIPVDVAGNNVMVPQGKTLTVVYSSAPSVYTQGL